MRKIPICHCYKPGNLCDCPTNWARCRECQADITWVTTANEKSMPVNGHIRADHYDATQQVSHFATCSARKRAARTAKPEPSTPRPQVVQLDIFAESAIQELHALRARQQGGL